MALTFADFLAQAMAQPILFVILVLIIGVTAVSGATDAPNAIASGGFHALPHSRTRPSRLAAVFNFVGLVGMTLHLHGRGEDHVRHGRLLRKHRCQALACPGGGHDRRHRLGHLLLVLRHPSFSKSHSLIAGITGGAVAHERAGRASCLPSGSRSSTAWCSPCWRALRWAGCSRRSSSVCSQMANRQRGQHRLHRYSRTCARCALSFLHGAQDGQKFMSIAHAGHRALLRQLGADAAPRLPHVGHDHRARGHLGRHGGGRQAHHQVRGHGHGEAGEVPGRGSLPLHGVHAARAQAITGMPVSTAPLQHRRPSWAWAPRSAFRQARELGRRPAAWCGPGCSRSPACGLIGCVPWRSCS